MFKMGSVFLRLTWAISNHDHEGHSEYDPETDVHQNFESLVPLKVSITHTGVVDAHTCNSDISLSVGETSHTNWIWRHEEENHKRPDDRDCAGNKVHVFPWRKSTIDVAEAIIDCIV